MERKSGILMPLFSLPGEYGCGTFGKEAQSFISCLAKGGFTYWQMLPLLVTDQYNSPYSSYSSFAGNPFFISPEALFEKGLITKGELLFEKTLSNNICDYQRIKNTRLPLLKRAALRIKNKDSVFEFSNKNPHIKAFCKFMKQDEEDFFVWQFIQYEFFEEFLSLREYANTMGIKLVGDIPFYSSPDSADVWEKPEFFNVDANGKVLLMAGVPPDYFSPEGQLWGNPTYNFDEMERDGYSWHVQKTEFWLKFFDGLRLDHFRAFESFWAVKEGEKTAKNGEWMPAPKMKIISKIKNIAKDKLIIAEDLGHITFEVEKLVEESGFMSTRVLQFGFDNENNLHTPFNYRENCVAYTGTHDNDTILGYICNLSLEKRKRLFEYCGYYGEDLKEGIKNIIKTVMASGAGITIFPLQDLAMLGTEARINTPGTVEKNWQWRISKEQLESIDFEYFYKKNELYGRK